MESFFTAGAVLLWIIIVIGLTAVVGILIIIGYWLLIFAGKIKRASRKRKLNKRIHTEGGGEDADFAD